MLSEEEKDPLQASMMVLCCADDGSSFPASSEALQLDIAAAESQRRLFETLLKKSCPRPLVISRLKSKDEAAGYGNCLCGDPSLLSAFTIQVSPPSALCAAADQLLC